MKTQALGVVFAATVIAGCAGFKMKAINEDKAAEDDARGFRYYETAPFLLVYSDSKGGLASEVIYLPDTTRKRSIEPYAYAASNKATLKFDHGRLAQAKGVVDETVVPVAVISALEKVATSTVKMMLADAPEARDTLPAPYLFRIHKGKSQDGRWSWSLKGGQALDPTGKSVSRIEYQP